MSVCPCGATLGHGESCSAGYFCEPCGEVAKLRNNVLFTVAFLQGMADRVARAGYPDLLQVAAADCRQQAVNLRKLIPDQPDERT